MKNQGTPINMFLLLLLHATYQVVVAEVAQDNIALPQEESRPFILPAPGIRHRPGGLQQYSSDFHEGPPILAGYESNIQQLQSPSGIVGNLLPLEPHLAMAQVVVLDVACQTDQMIVRIVFDGSFAGLMYAKGFYSVPQCNYVAPGTGGREFEFVVKVGTCGTQYVEGGPDAPSYLENVIVIQNEPGIQEVWDTARGVRCVFDGAAGRGDSSQKVSAALNVAMLEQKVVSFAADTVASASLDIQVGRGPFAPSASGMVKIGQLMTMVVGVEGPANADLLVRECVAHDGSHNDPYQLTDEKGCVLGSRKKLLGSWQKTRDTGIPKVPVLAYSHFQAFKFPDKNDVYIECQVDLCTDGCPVCPEDGVSRKRRSLPVFGRGSSSRWGVQEEQEDEERSEGSNTRNSISSNNKNESSGEAVRLARKLRVISPEDYSLIRDSPITLVTKDAGVSPGDMCMSVSSFVVGLVTMFVVLVASSVVTAVLCARVRTIPSTTSTYPPDTSFHAFSTVSGKTF
ncbi:uncharacterized protein [Procambarus clarkii]|uniref:uncharacterized protein n=1 Tax=Procambarus clarkii TaxID=6728 RepID=UPI001E67635D|nr:uncharacterized protein LOC123758325 [Procambarus clarkii]